MNNPLEDRANRQGNLKQLIRDQIRKQILASIDVYASGSKDAADTARKAEGAMQSKSDTTQIQNSWLADGLARLAADSHARLTALGEEESVEVSGNTAGKNSLLSLEDTIRNDTSWYFISDAGGSSRVTLEDDTRIFVISPESPLGKNLIGKAEGDTVSFEVRGKPQQFCVKSVI